MKTLLFISSIFLITQSAFALDTSNQKLEENKLAMVCGLDMNYQEICQVARLDELNGGVGGNHTVEPLIIREGDLSLAQKELIELVIKNQQFVDPLVLSKATKMAFADFMGGVGGN